MLEDININIPPGEYKAIEQFIKQIVNKYGQKIESIRLYGSILDGRYCPGESDIDILVISPDRDLDEEILDMETEISLKYGVVLSVLLDTPEEVKMTLKMGEPFIKKVIEKGKVLYEYSG